MTIDRWAIALVASFLIVVLIARIAWVAFRSRAATAGLAVSYVIGGALTVWAYVLQPRWLAPALVFALAPLRLVIPLLGKPDDAHVLPFATILLALEIAALPVLAIVVLQLVTRMKKQHREPRHLQGAPP